MGRKDHTSRRGDHGSPSEPAPLGNPLDFIQEDHLREREICNLIVRIAEAEQPDPDDISVVASFFSHELPPHLADEEQGLIHLLARRCRPEDEIGPLIARLDADRREAREEMAGLLALLNGAGADGFAFGDDNRARLRRYAARARRQLILEYAIILPFARLRLTAADLDALRRDMLARRGLDQLMEGKK